MNHNTHSVFAVSCAALLALASVTPAQADWAQLTPPNVPSPRVGHAMAYDLARDQVVLFGGYDGVSYLGDTWLFDGTDWTQVFPANTPSPRGGHPMAYDLGRGRVVLFGGVGGGTLGDTWEWDGQNWIQMQPQTLPPQRRSHPMIYDPLRQTVVMWGGYDGVGDINDMWEWNGNDWSQIVTANSPAPRRASEMAFDPVGGGIVLFSGYLQVADTWYFDGSDWRQLMPATVPSARYDHTMATDLLRNRVVMFGGANPADTWEWDGSDWIQRQPTMVPPVRYDDYLVYDIPRSRTLMFGGLLTVPDMWEYGTPNPGRTQPFGQGCNGTNGRAPALAGHGLPWIGESFRVDLGALPAASSGFVLTGFSKTRTISGVPLPINLGVIGMTGCNLLVDPLLATPVQGQNGSASFTLPVPNVVLLAGRSVFEQALALDPGANTLGLTVSNGVEGILGAK